MQILVRRLLTAIPTLLLLSLFVFLLLELAPGDAADVLLDQTASAADREAIRIELGLDRPLWLRYLDYLNGLLHGNLGDSARTGEPVAREIASRLPYTLVLVATAMALAMFAGISAGAFSALHRGTLWDSLVRIAMSIHMAIPVFWLAILLVSLFALKLRWLPVFGSETPRHLVLPAICTAFPLIPGIARLTRASLLETLGQDFVLVAYSKGLRSRAVLNRHVLPAAAIPVATYIGMQAARLIGGLIIVETIFNWPGLGGLAVRAAFDRDPLLLQGTTLAIAAMTFVILFTVDLLVLYLDPRLSRQAA
ncbi:MAG: ABC transporter permease [Anaerolineae bacterium]|nr:ABC transporter permease [Anaerolineae bacterium]